MADEVSFRVASVSTGSPFARRPGGGTYLLRLEVPIEDRDQVEDMLTYLETNPGVPIVRLVAVYE